jgi:hypothetical protein
MKLMKLKHSAILFLALTLLGAGWAQKPKITNAKIEEVPAGTSLKAAVEKAEQQAGPQWIGYRIPAKPTERTMCCFDSWSNDSRSSEGASSTGQCCKGCKMDSDHGTSVNGTVSDCAPPEPLPYAFVFLRLDNKRIEKARVFSADCPLDFAGLPMHWMEGVKPEESIDLLTGLALASDGEEGGRSIGHNAVMAIALHDVPAADTALEKLIQPDRPLSLRGNVSFWLGIERSKRGVEILEKAIKNDQDDRFREKVTFAFSQSYSQGKQEQALKDLIGMAHNDPSPKVRGQAIFWMAQIGGKKQAEQITEAIENDPETQVKEKAVFALSQLHDGEGVPLLIGVARNNKNPAVRKKAMFWLGQSHDPRALAYLEEILTR